MGKTSLSALAVALSLGLVTTAEAQDWSGPFVSFGVSSSATELGIDIGVPFDTVETGSDVAPYVAAGYDWQMGNLTFGFIGDIDAMNTEEFYLTGGKGVGGETDLFATLRGRIGVPVNDVMRVYASAGMAFMETSVSQLAIIGAPPESVRHRGTAAGLGLDYAVAPGRHLTFEYLHADFGTETLFDGAVEQTPSVNTLRIGLTFRF